MGFHSSFQHAPFIAWDPVLYPPLSFFLVCHQGVLCLTMPSATVTAVPLCCLFVSPALSFSSNIISYMIPLS